MTSEAQNAANKKNAQHSSGPRSDAGKKKSRQNALKHGLTAKLIDVLPSEDHDDYDNRINAFITDQPNLTASQLVIIKRIVSADWKLDRLDNAQNAAIGQNMRHAEVDMIAEAKKHAEEIGRRLIYEPLDRNEGPEWRNPIVQERIQKRNADHPKCLRFELERTLEGVDWLLDQWTCVRGMLRFYGFWHFPEKFTAIRLLGKRPEDLVEDCDIGAIMVGCNMLHVSNATWDLWNDCFQAKFGVNGRPMFREQIAHIEKQVKQRLFHDRPGAFKFLDELCLKEIARLTKLRDEVLLPITLADRASAARRAMFDASPSGLALTRYQGALTRELHRGVNDLMKKSKHDEALREDFEEDLTPETTLEVAAEPVAPTPVPVVERNEPISEMPKNPGVAPNDPRRESEPHGKYSYLDISVSRNKPSDGASGSKTDPQPPR